MEIQVVQGQSLLDIAVRYAGSVEAVEAIAQANGLSVTDELRPGQRLTVPGIEDSRIEAYCRSNDIMPCTALTDEDRRLAPFTGLGFIAFEVDFILT